MFERKVVNTERGCGASPGELYVVVLAVVKFPSLFHDALRFAADIEREDDMSVDLSVPLNNTLRLLQDVSHCSQALKTLHG